jgi:hypothetical protein
VCTCIVKHLVAFSLVDNVALGSTARHARYDEGEHVARHLVKASIAAAGAELEAGGGGVVALQIASLGAKSLAAMAVRNTEAAAAAVAEIISQLRRTEDGTSDPLAHAADLPHGAAVAAALKTAAHWTALSTAADADDADAYPVANAAAVAPAAAELYARAAKLAREAAASPAPAAATSALMADELVADIKLGVAQLALRAASPGRRRKEKSGALGSSDGDKEGGGVDDSATTSVADTVTAAEEAAAEAVTAAEALGGGGQGSGAIIPCHYRHGWCFPQYSTRTNKTR